MNTYFLNKTEKKYIYNFFTKSVFLIILFYLATISVQAQNFKPFTSLKVIKTKYFDIIYPKESEYSAKLLSTYADAVYEEISGLLGIDAGRRIPVTITPDTEQFNGNMSNIPYTHIVLFDTPMDIEWTSFENNFKSLFIHELTHAISLNSRGPISNVFHTIFGGWAQPTFLNAPLFMVEGVTVSFESLGGFGRANDPLTKEKLYQASYEDKFLTPFQLSGVYDLPPNHAAYYEYGGLFSAYIQQKYGMEKYAKLWQHMGKKYYISLFPYNSGYYHIFKSVYGITFLEAWEDFKKQHTLSGIKENPGIIPIGSETTFINAITAGKDKIYVADKLDQKIYIVDPKTEKAKTLMSADLSTYNIGISKDGKKMLVSSYRYSENLATATVTEYKTENGKKTGHKWKGLYKGQYFREGVVGLNSTLHNNNIVYRPDNRDEEVLLHGNEELVFSNPSPINDSWIIYTFAEKGVRSIGMYNYDTHTAYKITSSMQDDKERWRYIRDLHVSNNKILFTFNNDDRMFKLGVIDISAFSKEDSIMPIRFSNLDFSGGVFSPVQIDGEIFYKAVFADSDGLMKFPETFESVSGYDGIVWLTPLDADKQNLEISSTAEPDQDIKSKNYFALKYLNPFKFWLPCPLIRYENNNFNLDGAGIYSIMADPTDTHFIALAVLGDFAAEMAWIDFNWLNEGFFFPLDIAFSDKVKNMTGDSYRSTKASVTGTYSHGLGNEHSFINLAAGFELSLSADNPKDNSSAYTWNYDDPDYTALIGLDFSNYHRYPWELFGTGASINGYGRSTVDNFEPRTDVIINFALNHPFAFQLSIYGAYEENGGMDLQGESKTYDSFFANIASAEYSTPESLYLKWVTGGELEIKLFSTETQDNISHLYFNRLYSTLAYRGVLYDDHDNPAAEGNQLGNNLRLAQSLILRLGTMIKIIPIKLIPLTFSPSLWGAWKISNINDGENNDFQIGFSLLFQQ